MLKALARLALPLGLAVALAACSKSGETASVGKVGGRIFAILNGADGDTAGLSFKCSDVAFRLLPEVEGIEPAPYLARAKWVRATRRSALLPDELAAYLVEAHRLVASRLPRRLQAELGLTVAIAAARDRS